MILCPQLTHATHGSLRAQDSRSVDMVTDKAQKSLPGTDQGDDPGERVLCVRQLVGTSMRTWVQIPSNMKKAGMSTNVCNSSTVWDQKRIVSGFPGYQPSSRFSERPSLKGIRPEVMEPGTQ